MSQISTAKSAITNIPIEDDAEQPNRQAQTDALVAVNRANTPQSALDKRRTPRLSIAELNALDMDQLKQRLAKVSDDDRTPMEKTLDLLDLPRNTVANIAVGKPSVGGVAGLIGGPAAAGAAIGAIGGLPGAALGGAVGAGLGAAGALVGLAGRALGSSGFRQQVQENAAPGGTGAADQPRIQTSDVLRTLGVKNNVVNALAGFAGDVAFDPLTYVGPAGWGVKVTAGEAGNSLLLRGSEARSLTRAIRAAAVGGEAAAKDAHWVNYIKTKGLVGQPADVIRSAIYGDARKGLGGGVEKVFSVLGGDQTRYGGSLLNDFYSPVVNEATMAARAAVEKSVKGTGRALKFGVAANDVGSEVLHLPFTDMTVQVPGFTSAARSAKYTLAMSRLRDLGAGETTLRNATASEVFTNATKIADLTQESQDLSQNAADFRARIKEIDLTPNRGPETPTGPLPAASPDVANVVTTTTANTRDPSFQIGDLVQTKPEPGRPPLGDTGKPITDIQFGSDGSAWITVQGDSRPIPAEQLVNLSRKDYVTNDAWARTTNTPQPPALSLSGDSAARQGTLYDARAQAELTGNPGGFVPPPLSPSQQARATLRSKVFGMEQRQQQIADEVRLINERNRELLAQTNPVEAAKSITTAQDVLAQTEAVRMADRMVAEAQTQVHQLKIAANFPSIEAMDPAEAAAQIGEDLYYIAVNDPARVEQLAELAQQRLESAQAAANALDAPLMQVLGSTDHDLINYVKSWSGLDDDAVAVSVFGKLGNALRDNWGQDGDSALVRRLNSIDQWWRTMFGARGGSTARKIAQATAIRADAYQNAQKVREEIQQRVLKALGDAGVTDAGRDNLPDLNQYVHLRAHELADPTGAAYYQWKFDPAGPKYGADGKLSNPSLLRDRIEKLVESGVLQNPEARAALDAIAREMAPTYREALLAGQDVRLFDTSISGYVGPNTLSEATQKVVDTQARNFQNNLKQGFLEPRTTHQIRYVDPQTGEWRRFFVFDQALLDEYKDIPKVRPAEQYDAAGNFVGNVPPKFKPPETPEELIRKDYAYDSKLASQLIEARDSAKRFNELKKTDPAFAEKVKSGEYGVRPTDPIELNEMAQTGRFDKLTGGVRGTDSFFDADAGVVMENYYATAQRVIAKRMMTDLIDKNAKWVNPDDLLKVAAAPGKTVKLPNGVSLEIIPRIKSSLNTEVAAARIGDVVYRQLDPEVWSRFGESLLGLSGKDVAGALVHPVLADRIEDFTRTFNARGFEQILAGLDKVGGWWKMFTLSHPSWPIFNLVGNSSLAITGGAKVEHMFDPVKFRDAITMMRKSPEQLADMTVVAGDVTYSGQQFLQMAEELGVLKNNLSLEAAGQFAQQNPGLMATADRKLRGYLSGWFRMSQKADDVIRLQAFRSFLDQGFSAKAAVEKVLYSMFDFADFTAIEKSVFKRLIPFYSWMRSNLGYQMHLLMQRPMYAAMAPRIRQALEDAVSGEAAVPQEQRPSWMRDAMAAQIGSDPESRFGLLFGNGVLPVTDIYNIMQPITGTAGALKFIKYFTSGLSPVLTTPLQLGTGVDFFSQRSIGADVGNDLSPAEFLAGQVRPLAEYGPGGKVAKAFDQGVGQGIARALVGGRVQSMDEQRISSSRERELRDRENLLRTAIRRGERAGDQEAMRDAQTQLLSLYRRMTRLGYDIPNWAEDQLAQMAPNG